MSDKKPPSPTKFLAIFFLALLYAVLTYRLLFVAVPAMLREADTTINTLAIIAAVAWLIVPATYLVSFLYNRKITKKGNDAQ